MSVLVDTSVWSLALRRRSPSPNAAVVEELIGLVRDGRARIIGPIRQELLTGIKVETHFEQVREHLDAFPDLPLVSADYVNAARLSNRCRANGIQGTEVDLLICAVAVARRLPIFTTDGDFAHYRKVIDLELHAPAS
ncbi:MAG: PIN domain-containing protein [Deltaproteobacteria bacterium]|nr:PIN domain-containing protein [Deltaproteobacteria bacterium]